MKQQSSISEQMKQIADKVPRSKMFQLAPLMTIGHDGVNHINIWESGETNLGKALSSFTALPFEHSEHGYFVSIEGFWHYIRSVTKDDNLRLLSGHNARTYGRTLESLDVRDVYFVMADANWQKIKAYPALVGEIKNLKMPFDSYYLQPEKGRPKSEWIRARSLHARFLVPAFHEIHEAIHQDREPDFTFLKDENKGGVTKFSHPLVARETSDGGFNANLFYMYAQKPAQNKPKQKAAVLKTSPKPEPAVKEAPSETIYFDAQTVRVDEVDHTGEAFVALGLDPEGAPVVGKDSQTAEAEKSDAFDAASLQTEDAKTSS